MRRNSKIGASPLVLAALAIFATHAYAAHKPTASQKGGKQQNGAAKAATKAAGSPAGETAVINDSWYTMQAGSTPFGYFHEVIESRDGRYSYRYALKKFENNGLYDENIGALAQADLTPIAFNLNKSGGGTTESTNATYSPNKQGGIFAVQVTGTRAATFKRACTNGTILDVFFPVYLRLHWDKVQPGFRGWLKTFAEDPEHGDFRPRMVHYEVKGRDAAADCTNIHIEMDSVRADWCMTSEGAVVDIKVGSYRVHRVHGETEAKAFVAGVFPKEKSQ